MDNSLSLVVAGGLMTLIGMSDSVQAQTRCETTPNVNHCGVFSTGRITPNYNTNRFLIDHEPGFGQNFAYVLLKCHSTGVTRTIFKARVDVRPGTSITKACGAAPHQSFPFIFNSTCGDLQSCTG